MNYTIMVLAAYWTSTFKLIPVSENKEPSNSEMEETE